MPVVKATVASPSATVHPTLVQPTPVVTTVVKVVEVTPVPQPEVLNASLLTSAVVIPVTALTLLFGRHVRTKASQKLAERSSSKVIE